MVNPAQHNDFGEKIGGARKDLWQGRGLFADDLSTMNSREAEKYVKKDNVWKKPNYQAMIDSGIPADIVYFIKTVRDSLNTTPQYYYPDDTAEKRLARQKQYVNTIREVQSVVENIKTKADVFQAYENVLVSHGYIERFDSGAGGNRHRATGEGQENPVITNKLLQALHISSEREFEYKLTQKAAKDQFGIPKEQRVPRGYEVLYNDGKNSWSKNDDWLPNTYYVTKGYRIVKMNLESREDAVKWAQDAASKVQTSGKKKRFVPPQLEHIQRDGIDYRHGRDVGGQDYLDCFVFKGGEFGNWMSQNDRQASLNMGFDALKDLADALKISDKDISYQGNLSIAFGSRGSGNAVAHYEPLRRVINLTKMRGAGSLAHEWWHGLDDYMGQKLGVKGLLSENANKHPLFKKLIDTIKYKLETPEQAAERFESRNIQTKKNAGSWLDSAMLPSLKRKGTDEDLEEYESLKSDYLRGELGSVNLLNTLKKSVTGHVIPKSERDTLLTYERILRSMDATAEPTSGKTLTEYYTNSRKMGNACEKDGGYWDSNIEMTARAFATYVTDKLPGKSDYLIGHAECAVDMIFDEDGTPHILKAYPEGEERKAINAVFDEIVAELKLQKHLSHDDRIPPTPTPQVRPEARKTPPVTLEKIQDTDFEQMEFKDTLSRHSESGSINSIRFLRKGQDSHEENWSLYEYIDRVELHHPDGIEQFIPSDGQTTKEVFVSHMRALLNEGFSIKAMPPVANDIKDLVPMLDILGVKVPDDCMEP